MALRLLTPAVRLPCRISLPLACLALLLADPPLARAERINHAGRILGPQLTVANATLFNTPEADAILASLQVLPRDNPWNEDVSHRPVLKNSDAMIARINADLSSSRRSLRAFQEMNFVLVPDAQPLAPIQFVDYPDESDPGPYPIPPNMPIETWPSQTGGLTLQEWQRDVAEEGGDRHAIIVRPGSGHVWEMWQAKLVGADWEASNGAQFDLKSNGLRPAGWTSGDAAGLPMFPALVRYDECQRGVVEHACRIVVAKTRRAYIYPANHYASTIPATETNVPAMGQRLRLKSNFVIPENWSTEERAILAALKKYGALVADNGGFFSISITPDHRWPANAFSHLSTVGITNFEVVHAAGPLEGPRSPGAPAVDAGRDVAVSVGLPLTLQGSVSSQGAAPPIAWTVYSGPGPVTFGDPGLTNTTAIITIPGVYTLMLSADDQVHTPSYDAVVVTVSSGLRATLELLNDQLWLSWIGGAPPFVVESAPSPSGPWQLVYTGAGNRIAVTNAATRSFFRARRSGS